MKTVTVVILSALLLLFSGCAQKVNDSADIQAIKTACQDFVKAYQARDVNALCSTMADNAIFAPGNVPPAVGKEAIQKMVKGIFDQLEPFDIEFAAMADDVQVSGNLAVAHGTYTRKLTHKTGVVAPSTDSGNWTAAWQRQGDGSWKCVSDLGTSSQLLPGTTADGADEKALIQIEQDMAVAFMKRDTAALDKMNAKEWAWTMDGQYQTRAQVYGDVKNSYKLTSVAMKEISPHVFGDFAIVTMIGELKGTFKGKDASGRANAMDFFVKRNGRWQCVYSQNTTIKS